MSASIRIMRPYIELLNDLGAPSEYRDKMSARSRGFDRDMVEMVYQA